MPELYACPIRQSSPAGANNMVSHWLYDRAEGKRECGKARWATHSEEWRGFLDVEVAREVSAENSMQMTVLIFVWGR